jgi:hypothetical protein
MRLWEKESCWIMEQVLYIHMHRTFLLAGLRIARFRLIHALLVMVCLRSIGIVVGETAMVGLGSVAWRRPRKYLVLLTRLSVPPPDWQQLQYPPSCDVRWKWQEGSRPSSESAGRGSIGCWCDRARECCDRDRMPGWRWYLSDHRPPSAFSCSWSTCQDNWKVSSQGYCPVLVWRYCWVWR